MPDTHTTDWPRDLAEREADIADDPQPPFVAGEVVLLRNQPFANPVEISSVVLQPWIDALGKPMWQIAWRHRKYGEIFLSNEPRDKTLVRKPEGWVAPPDFDLVNRLGSLRAQLAYLDDHDDMLIQAFERPRLHAMRVWVLMRIADEEATVEGERAAEAAGLSMDAMARFSRRCALMGRMGR